jgi:PAS domain S-box-containing protein
MRKNMANPNPANIINEPEAVLKDIVNRSPDAIVITDLLGNIIFASKMAFDLLGYNYDEDVTGKSVTTWIAPDFKMKAVENIKNVVMKTPSKDNAYKMVKRDGSTIWADINATLLFNEAGMPRAIVSFVHDVTQRKEMEETLKAKLNEVEALNETMVGRENKMAELKKEVNDLLRELGKPEKY